MKLGPKTINDAHASEAKDLHSPPAVAVEVEGDRLLARSLLPPHHPPCRPRVDPSPQLHADSSHAYQPVPPTQQVEQIPITWDGQKGCINLLEGFTWPQEEDKQIRKSFDYRAGRRYQQIMRDFRGGELQRLKWLSETLRERLLHRFATDPSFLKRSGVCKVNRASPKGGCLYTGGSATIPKTCARMTRSLDRPPTEAETEFSANFEQATQQAQEEGDETTGTVDPDVVWRQTLSEPCKNRVYGAGGFFTSSLLRSGYRGSSAFATCS
ncbi:hypothetical protein PIB30_016106 [Stylosanthes scabra]|uniref:Uncharacterized protein n=1 Tax=Stylosanthes scabra TaxID=79078 RepID=A0ABU6Q789_9FABA|nr:hypothetical protein [Stylosanthes scabra]